MMLKYWLMMYRDSSKVRSSTNIVFYICLEAQIMVPCLTKYSSSGVSESINDRMSKIEKIKDEMNEKKVVLL